MHSRWWTHLRRQDLCCPNRRSIDRGSQRSARAGKSGRARQAPRSDRTPLIGCHGWRWPRNTRLNESRASSKRAISLARPLLRSRIRLTLLARPRFFAGEPGGANRAYTSLPRDAMLARRFRRAARGTIALENVGHAICAARRFRTVESWRFQTLSPRASEMIV